VIDCSILIGKKKALEGCSKSTVAESQNLLRLGSSPSSDGWAPHPPLMPGIRSYADLCLWKELALPLAQSEIQYHILGVNKSIWQ